MDYPCDCPNVHVHPDRPGRYTCPRPALAGGRLCDRCEELAGVAERIDPTGPALTVEVEGRA